MIGIGDEPPLKANGKNQSYNSLRADIFENAIEEAVLNELREFKGKDVTFNGKQTKFNDLFMEQSAKFILEKLDENKDRFETQLSKLGLKDADLTNDKFKEHIKTHLRKNIQKGIDKLVDVKDQKAELCGSNSQKIFAIPTREGKKISVNTLAAMTVTNNGTIAVETKSKPPRSQALQQEMGTSSKKDEKLAESSESKKAKLDSEALSIQSVKHDVKHDISKKRITSKEVNQYQHQIADRDEMKRLMLMGRVLIFLLKKVKFY